MMKRGPKVAILLIVLVCLGFSLVLLPVPFYGTSTYAVCMRHVPPNTLFPCDTDMTGYGSVTYDLVGYGGFAGPYTHIDQYHLFL
jgi:hypothetical protein